MVSLLLPVRVAAGLAATAFEQTRKLPSRLVGLPLTVASQTLQLSMRIQQQFTQLAVKGDEVLAGFREPEEQPAWATFDEDGTADTSPPPSQPRSGFERAGEDEESAEDTTTGVAQVIDERRAVLPEYDHLTLAQLRARLRRFSEAELVELLDHERNHGAREDFVRLLSNRLDRVRTQGGS